MCFQERFDCHSALDQLKFDDDKDCGEQVQERENIEEEKEEHVLKQNLEENKDK